MLLSRYLTRGVTPQIQQARRTSTSLPLSLHKTQVDSSTPHKTKSDLHTIGPKINNQTYAAWVMRDVHRKCKEALKQENKKTSSSNLTKPS
tara:strand:+ start:310 stop:582 length:273 start_codon:yes stop_codon:yes gene_type:complete